MHSSILRPTLGNAKRACSVCVHACLVLFVFRYEARATLAPAKGPVVEELVLKDPSQLLPFALLYCKPKP